MSVKIRLKRKGRKRHPLYDIVIADSRAPRDGKFVGIVGNYDPNQTPAAIEIDEEKTLDWLLKGAQPTQTVRNILSYTGVLLKKHLQLGVRKNAITQTIADDKYKAWREKKNLAKINILYKGKVAEVTKG